MADDEPAGAHPPVAFYGLWPKFADPGDGAAAGDSHREPVMRLVAAWPGAFEPEAQPTA